MRKNNLWMLLLLMLSALACFSVSCKDDDDENETTEVVNNGDGTNDPKKDSTGTDEDTTASVVVVRDGALMVASYKVSDTTSVYFSQGNLQFNAVQGTHATADGETAKGTWRFAENQYDVILGGNENIAEDYDGWIDLFGFGTSGWNGGNAAYQPWSTSEEYSDYFVNAGDFASKPIRDWGVYNAISNGGNEPNQWRTLMNWEWKYLFQNNDWTLGYVKTSEKDSILCCFLIPDGFSAPDGVTVKVISDGLDFSEGEVAPDYESFKDNTYTTEQFESLEQLGVVALPGGGCREGATELLLSERGRYWSGYVRSIKQSWGFFFSANSETWATDVSVGACNHNMGLSVRLVQNVQ